METLRYPTLQAWAEGICNAVRAKDGTADPIGHQDLPDRILAIQTGSNIDLSGITAQQPDVSERVQYIDATGELKYGTMPEITAVTKTLDGGNTEYVIEEGHHGGSGKVRIVPETLYAAPSRSTQELDSPAGKVYTKVILDPIPDIYTDVSGADATPAQVLQGSKFVGAAGSVEEGGIEIRSGKRFTVTSNGNKSISSAYYDSSAYFEVNVPQTIVSGSGEDSTGTSAVAADIRKGKTARSKGRLVTGTMPDAKLEITPAIVENNDGVVVAIANCTVKEGGFIEKGSSNYANSLNEIQKYTTYNDTTNIVTPGKTAITLYTSGKYCPNNIKIAAVESDGENRAYAVTLRYTGTDSITIPLSSFSAYSASKFIRLYIHCLESYDSYNVISSYAYITSEHQILTYYDGDNGKFRVDHTPEIIVEFNSKSISLSSNNMYYFNGTYEICVVCKA